MPTLNVRTTRKIPKTVVYDYIEIPRELIENNQEFILCMNIMLMNQQALLTSIYKDMWFRGLFPIFNKTKEESYSDLYTVMIHHSKRSQ